jgi:hypothetical protein
VARRGALATLTVIAALAATLALPAASQAWYQSFCGIVLVPGGGQCWSGGPHSLEHSAAYYPGNPAHHDKPCTYIRNTVNGNIRGNLVNCRWSDQGGHAAVNFGDTYAVQYRAYAYLHSDTCCNHTINAFTFTTEP